MQLENRREGNQIAVTVEESNEFTEYGRFELRAENSKNKKYRQVI